MSGRTMKMWCKAMPDFLRRLIFLATLLLPALFTAAPAAAEDGYDLWLRYRPLPPALRQNYGPLLAQISVTGSSPALRAAEAELKRGVAGLLGPRPGTGGVLIAGTPSASRTVAGLRLPLAGLGEEGYLIRSVMLERRRATLIAA